MNLSGQIALINVPQEFTRLCNVVLGAEHGANYLPIDDDRPDKGNDGYLVSEKRVFAGHCFKRLQNQSIDQAIKEKMLSDLNKAIKLKKEGTWEVEAWTFLCNYPISEDIAQKIVSHGKKANITVSWHGPDFFADALQRHKSIRTQFPSLEVNETMEKLDIISKQLAVKPKKVTDTLSVNVTSFGVPRTIKEERLLLETKPQAWEYLLFAGSLLRGKEALEVKWRDHELGYARRTGKHLDNPRAAAYISDVWNDLSKIVGSMAGVLSSSATTRAFGLPGEPGDPDFIKHLALRVITSYEEILDWAADLRGTTVSNDMDNLFKLAAKVTDRPLMEVRSFVDRVVTETDKLPELLAKASGEPITLELTLALSIDDEALSEFQNEMETVKRKLTKGI